MRWIPAPIPRPCLAVIALVALFGGAEVQAADAPPTILSATPRQGDRDQHLKTVWKAGLDDDFIFGRIRAVVERDDQGVYVLDGQLNEIQALSRDGEWESTIGREGEAPGEFRNPSDLFLRADGTLAVVQTMPPKIALLSADGVPLDDHRIPDPNTGVRMLTSGVDRGGGLVLSSSGMFFAQGKMETQARLFAIDEQGGEVARYYQDHHAVNLASEEFNEEDMTGVNGAWAMTPNGDVVLAPSWDTYRIDDYGSDGTLLRTVERPFETHERTAQERERASHRYSMNINGKVMEVQVNAVDRAIDGLYPRPEGGFRVLTRERRADDPPEFFARIDEFDEQGRWVEQRRLLGDVDLDRDQLFLGANRLYVARNAHAAPDEDEDDLDPEPLHLVCYRLEP